MSKRHPLHSLCPYFAMFPEEFVTQQVREFTSPGDQVFDPFCGRGTTIFESLLQDREAAGVDINPVAACVAGAKADAPDLQLALDRLQQLETIYTSRHPASESRDEFFQSCFERETFNQIMFLRNELAWRESRVDRFLAAVVLGCLHGESHKSPNYLSNQMPRTISTKPSSSVRWWAARNLKPPMRNAFEIVRKWVAFRLNSVQSSRRGRIALQDVRKAHTAFPDLVRKVDLVITSPPYLDTTNYREDQWLRLWFLGGPSQPTRLYEGDDRYRSEEPYWSFLTEAWGGCANLLKDDAVIVIRIGGRRLNKEQLPAKLLRSLRQGLQGFTVEQFRTPVESEIVKRQTNSFRPGSTAKRFEYDFVFILS